MLLTTPSQMIVLPSLDNFPSSTLPLIFISLHCPHAYFWCPFPSFLNEFPICSYVPPQPKLLLPLAPRDMSFCNLQSLNSSIPGAFITTLICSTLAVATCMPHAEDGGKKKGKPWDLVVSIPIVTFQRATTVNTWKQNSGCRRLRDEWVARQRRPPMLKKLASLELI